MARSKSDKAFDERVAQYSEELRELLTDLYGEQADEAFPADLKRLDTKRLADPEWYKRGNMFGMTMYTDLFAGDLKKLADKVPYLKEQSYELYLGMTQDIFYASTRQVQAYLRQSLSNHLPFLLWI